MYEELTLDYVWSRINEDTYDKNNRNNNFYHVSALLQDFYPPYFKHLKQTQEQKTLNFFTGNLLHNFVISKSLNEVELKADIEKMIPIFDEKPPLARKNKCLLGKFDDLISILGKNILIDKKTTNLVPPKMPNYYFMQLNFYKLLIYIHYKIDIEYGQIVYFDVQKKFNPHVREEKLLPLEQIQKIILEKLEKLDLGTI